MGCLRKCMSCVICLMSHLKTKKELRGSEIEPVFPEVIEDRLPDTSLLYILVINGINTNGSVT